jgi:hypothetical protein
MSDEAKAEVAATRQDAVQGNPHSPRSTPQYRGRQGSFRCHQRPDSDRQADSRTPTRTRDNPRWPAIEAALQVSRRHFKCARGIVGSPRFLESVGVTKRLTASEARVIIRNIRVGEERSSSFRSECSRASLRDDHSPDIFSCKQPVLSRPGANRAFVDGCQRRASLAPASYPSRPLRNAVRDDDWLRAKLAPRSGGLIRPVDVTYGIRSPGTDLGDEYAGYSSFLGPRQITGARLGSEPMRNR